MLIVVLLNRCLEIVKLIITCTKFISSLARHNKGLQNSLHMAGFVFDAPARVLIIEMNKSPMHSHHYQGGIHRTMFRPVPLKCICHFHNFSKDP